MTGTICHYFFSQQFAILFFHWCLTLEAHFSIIPEQEKIKYF